MNIATHRKNRELSLLTYFFGFMHHFAWKATWVPIKKEKVTGKTNQAMKKAAEYLSTSEIGRGLSPMKFISSWKAIQNWKFYFVANMKDKVNQQAEAACDKRISVAAARGKKIICHHNGHLLGTTGASALADSLFRMHYDNETRAQQEAPMDPYFTRDPGPVEFGQSMCDSEFLPRQFAEQPTGEFYLQAEDEHAVSWKMEGDEFFSDDEIVEDEQGFHERIDWDDRNDRYFDLRRLLLHRAFSAEKILRKAQMLAKTDGISGWQMKKLREFAAAVANYRVRKTPVVQEEMIIQEEVHFVTIR